MTLERRTLHNHILRRIWRALALMLLLAGAACSGLGGEPAIVATLPVRVAATETITLPQQPPNLAVGAEIFAARCSRCHGIDGGGMGELVLTGQLPEPVMDFNDLSLTRGKTPQQWFVAITNGNLEKLMPPWRDTLSVQERWDVAYFAYTLAYETGQVARGQAVYEQACASCHGAGGRGDGAEAPGPMPDLTDQSRMVLRSDNDLLNAVTNGVGQAMPSFADDLDETQRRDAVAYVRALALGNAQVIDLPPLTPPPAEVAQVPPPAATEEAQAAPTTAAGTPVPTQTVPAEAVGTVTGTIISGTADAPVPADLTVTLHIVDDQFSEQNRETTLNPDGSFTFADVPIRADRRYFTTVMFAEGFFVSDMLRGDPASPALDLPITVYDVTVDPSVVQIQSVLAQIAPSTEGLQVIQIVTYRNTSDRIFLSREVVDEFRQESVRLTLPQGAVIREFADSTERYIIAEDGGSLVDTQPVFPGENHIVHVLYTLPFSGSADIVQPLDYPLTGSFQMLVDSALRLSSSQLIARGAQTMGGATYETYSGALSLGAGETVRYTVTGAPASSTASAGGTANNNIVLAAALFAAGAGALLAAAIIYWRGRTVPATAGAAPADSRQQQIDELVQQIAELDAAHDADEISRSVYRKRRQALKDRLSALLQENESQ